MFNKKEIEEEEEEEPLAIIREKIMSYLHIPF
jgi:hypothetical protein